MMSLPEPFLAAEIEYRRERITESFSRSRRHRRSVEQRRQSRRTVRHPRRSVAPLVD